MSDTLSAFFTAIAGIAAVVAVVQARGSAREQRELRLLEKRSRQFESFVIDHIRAAASEFDREIVEDLCPALGAFVNFRATGDPSYSAVFRELDGLIEKSDQFYYRFRGKAQSALATWPDEALADRVLGALEGLQERYIQRIEGLASQTPGDATLRDLRDKTGAVLRLLLDYDIMQHLPHSPTGDRSAESDGRN